MHRHRTARAVLGAIVAGSLTLVGTAAAAPKSQPQPSRVVQPAFALPVSQLTTSQITATSVRLTWTNPTGPTFDHTVVRVKRGVKAPQSHRRGRRVASVARRHQVADVLGLTPKTTYSFAVFGVSRAGHFSHPATVTIATTAGGDPPLPVVDLRSMASDHVVYLRWRVQSFGHVVVRRDQGRHAPRTPTSGQRVTDVHERAAYAEDQYLKAATTYSYSLFTKDNEHQHSARVSVTVTTKEDVDAPGAPTDLVATPTTSGVMLGWQNSNDTDLRGSMIRRSTGATPPDGPNDGTLVGIVDGSTARFADSHLDPEVTYSYSVFNFDYSANVSNPASVRTASTRWVALRAPTPPDAGTDLPTSIAALGCTSLNVCIAAGNYYDRNDQEQLLVDTESDGAWTASDGLLPTDAATDPEVGVAGLSCGGTSTCALAVSYTAIGGDRQSVIEMRTDNGWVITSISSPEDSDAYLTSITCPAQDSCVAIGEYDDEANHQRGLVATYAGGQWVITDTVVPPDAAGDSYSTSDVTADSLGCRTDGTCVISGTYVDTGDIRHYFLDTNLSGQWQSVRAPLPTAGSFDGYPLGVACPSEGACVAAGDYTDGDQHGTAVDELTDAGWSSSAAPNVAGTNDSPGGDYGASTPVACDTTTSCKILTNVTTEPSYDGAAVSVDSDGLTSTSVAAPLEVAGAPNVSVHWRTLTCPRTGDCLGTGRMYPPNETEQGVFAVLDGDVWTTKVATVPDDAAGFSFANVDTVSCAASDNCTAGGIYQAQNNQSYGMLETLRPAG